MKSFLPMLLAWPVYPDERVQIIVLSNVHEVPVIMIAKNLEALMFDEDPTYPIPTARGGRGG